MNRSKALTVTVGACLVLLGLGSAARATDVVWQDITYHKAAITSVSGDRVTITGTRDSDGTESTFEMPLSNVPDEVIQAYRATHDAAGRAMAERPLTAKEEKAVKAESAERRAKLSNLKDALSKDPNHPMIVAGHILLKNAEGVVINCDASTPPDVPQSTGTVFLKDCPGARKLERGDPIAAIGYSVGEHIYNFQHIKAFSIRPPPRIPETPPSSTGPTPASSP